LEEKLKKKMEYFKNINNIYIEAFLIENDQNLKVQEKTQEVEKKKKIDMNKFANILKSKVNTSSTDHNNTNEINFSIINEDYLQKNSTSYFKSEILNSKYNFDEIELKFDIPNDNPNNDYLVFFYIKSFNEKIDKIDKIEKIKKIEKIEIIEKIGIHCINKF
jgi:hypothetical protein